MCTSGTLVLLFWNKGSGLKPQSCSEKSVFFCELDPKTPTLLLSFCLDKFGCLFLAE